MRTSGGTDPFNNAVWDYNITLALEAAKEGFDEIQFDYVRFPDQKGLQFSRPNTEANRREAIVSFLAEAGNRLLPYNVFLSADNFGYVCCNVGHTGIGQCFSDIGTVGITFRPCFTHRPFSLEFPDFEPLNDPYRIVFASLQRAKERTGFPPLTFRPWLQAFNDYAFDRRKFGKRQLQQQIKAAQDSGADGWLLWIQETGILQTFLQTSPRELGWNTKELANELRSK